MLLGQLIRGVQGPAHVLKIEQKPIAMTFATAAQTSRDSWADFAKGLTIILVVMMHSTLGVELATGKSAFMADIVAFARAFRMPLFFAISGLFAASAIHRLWSRFADTKLIHFAYFYVLWSVLQIGARLVFAGQGNHEISWQQLFLIPIEPFGTIWFIYVLPFFFLIARFVRSQRAGYVLCLAGLLSPFQTNTGWIAFDATTKYLFFFLAGLYGWPLDPGHSNSGIG